MMKIQVIYDRASIVHVAEYVGGTTVTALNVLVDEREAAQEMLTRMGYDTNPIDEFFAPLEELPL